MEKALEKQCLLCACSNLNQWWMERDLGQTRRHLAYTCPHRFCEQGLPQHPSDRSVRTSVVQRTQDGANVPCLASCLGANVSEHCSFPEIPSGHLEVPKEEDSGWAVQVAAQALPTISPFQACPWGRDTEPPEPGHELSGPGLLAQTCNPNCS